MADFIFVVKTFLATFILVILMQIQIGGRTIENHVHKWIRGSAIATELRSVATGGARMINNGYDSSLNFLAKHLKTDIKNEQTASARGFGFSWENSARDIATENRERIRQLESEVDETQIDEESPEAEDSTL